MCFARFHGQGLTSVSSHLFDVAHRETFESAHSVVLTIFSSHAQRLQVPAIPDDGCSVGDVVTMLQGKKNRDALSVGNGPQDDTTFVQRMVPFYADCLIKVCRFSFP